jgi:hypothetical protein
MPVDASGLRTHVNLLELVGPDTTLRKVAGCGHHAADGDHRLDRVSRLEGALQARAESQPGHREGVLEPLQQAGRGAGMLDLEALGQCPELGLGSLRITLPLGLVELAADERPLGLGQMLEHVAALVRP